MDFSTKILGFDSSMPVYITATALGRVSFRDESTTLTVRQIRTSRGRSHAYACGRQTGHHPDGEPITCHLDSPQIPTLASCSFDEMVDAAVPGQVQFMQLYVNSDRSRTKKIIAHAVERGIKALFITVDAPQLGRREKVRHSLGSW